MITTIHVVDIVVLVEIVGQEGMETLLHANTLVVDTVVAAPVEEEAL